MPVQFRLFARALMVVVALLAVAAWSAIAHAQSTRRTQAEIEQIRKQVIYLVMTDRFFNGDPKNDELENPGENDPTKKSLTKFHGGDVAGVTQKLDYLKALGVNTVWITPVYKQVRKITNPNQGNCKNVGETGYHGYWPDFSSPDDGKMDARFGTKKELTNLITALHNNKMRFVMDKVVNHAGYSARVVKQQPKWFHPDCMGDIVNCPLCGLPDFKQEDKDVADFLVQMARGWVKEFEIDGIRMDTAKHVPLSFFKDRWIPAVRSQRDKLFLLAEVTGGDGEFASVGVLKKFQDAGFDSGFNFWLRDKLVAALGRGDQGSPLDGVASVVQETQKLGEDRALLLCNLLDNHDVQRFTNEAGINVAEDEIQRRYRAALVLLFTLPGIPQLYYGNELGMYGGPDPDNRRSMPDWAWTEKDRKKPRGQRDPNKTLALPDPAVTFNWCRDLIGIRGSNPALYNGSYAELWRPNGQQNAYAFFRGAGDNRLIIVVNESDQIFKPASGVPLRGNDNLRQADKDAFKDGAVLERLFDQNSAPATLQVSKGNLTVSLPARAIGVYRLRS